MPSEQPRLPKETYAYLLGRGGNTHMPIVGNEVAEYGPGKASAQDALDAIIPSLVGVVFFFLLVGMFLLGWRMADYM